MPTEHQGDHALMALLRDKLTIHDLFECFVRNFFHLHLKQYTVKREYLQWHEEPRSSFMPRMETDITLVGKHPPHARLIIDTKYSVETLSDNFKFKSENLYQIYAYLRTQENLSESHRQAEGMLLYPTTTDVADESMCVQGHRIRIATLNLADDWKLIEKRLRELVEPRECGVLGQFPAEYQTSASIASIPALHQAPRAEKFGS